MTTPGPGAYSSNGNVKLIIPKWSMGTGQRNKLYECNNSPGPGSYEKPSGLSGPKYHFAGKQTRSLSNFAPGPGQYTPNSEASKKRVTFKYSMPGRGDDMGVRNNAPGPGSYTFNGPGKYCGGKFGRDPRGTPILPSGRSVPGPGAYEGSKRGSSTNTNSPKFS